MVVKTHPSYSYGYQKRPTVRIVLVGDQGVGKTSIILSLVSEEFPENVPQRAEEITIPADVTPEQVPTSIVDTTPVAPNISDLDDSCQITQDINKASVICVVYSVDDEDSIERLSTYWLPLIRQCRSSDPETAATAICPVVLVGNKIDLVEYSTIEAVLPVMEAYSEIETCIECSAKTLKNVSEMFYYAQKAVLHPIPPIYSVENSELTEACRAALVRIFRICDIDCDGLLNDAELNNFQSRCFNGPLQPHVLDEVKAVLQKNIEDGVRNGAITMRGFLYLHTLFIQRGRNETAWTVLRKFGYGDELKMRKDYLCPTLKVGHGCTTELSHKGQQFIQLLFERFDRDEDGALSPAEYEELFATCPSPAWQLDELRRTVPTTEPNGWLTYQGYMCRWALQTLVDVPRTFEYFAYLGYAIYEDDSSQLSAVQITRDKRIDLGKRQSGRTVYTCHVIGPKACGRTSFCKGFLHKQGRHSLGDDDKDGVENALVANVVQVYGHEKVLVLRDIALAHISDALQPHQVHCDVACLIYDVTNSKSFEYVARIYIKYFAESKIPVLVVGCKSDLVEAKQEYLLQPAAFCQKYKILPPHYSSIKLGHSRNDVFVKLATMAAFPRFQAAWILFYRHRHLRDFGLVSSETTWWKAGLSIAAVTALGYLLLAKIVHTADKIR